MPIPPPIPPPLPIEPGNANGGTGRPLAIPDADADAEADIGLVFPIADIGLVFPIALIGLVFPDIVNDPGNGALPPVIADDIELAPTIEPALFNPDPEPEPVALGTGGNVIFIVGMPILSRDDATSMSDFCGGETFMGGRERIGCCCCCCCWDEGSGGSDWGGGAWIIFSCPSLLLPPTLKSPWYECE